MPETCGTNADGEAVWSWRAHAGAKFARDESLAPMTVAIKLVHRGERGVSRKPLCREGRDVSAEPVVNAPRIFFARGPWVRPAPGIPCALCILGG